MTICPTCGKDGPELLLLGDSDYLFKCRNCDMHILAGKRGPESCPKCKAHRTSRSEFSLERRLDEFEKLPGSLCDACKKNQDEIKAAVVAGGVYWRCKDCRASGALQPHAAMAKHVREQMKIAAPEPCGIEFSVKECPACGPNKVVESPRSPSPGGQ